MDFRQETFRYMFRISLSARRGSGSAFAVAAALAGGTVLGAALTATPAFAQRSEQQAASYSEEFAAAYQPVSAIVNAEDGDYAAAKAQLPGVLALVQTADDRFAAGNLSLILGNKLKDPALQRQGLELMVASGKADPAQLGQFQFFIGSLAFNAEDWAAARTALQAAIAAGYSEGEPEALIAESYFSEGLSAQGLDYLKGVIDQRAAAGQAVPETWLLRGLQVAYSAQLSQQANDWSALLVANNPTEENWTKALQVVEAVNTLEPQVQLDLLRLMSVTNALSQRREYVNYIETADPRIMANEVAAVLDKAVQAGVLSTSDEYYTEIKRVVDERAPADRAEAPTLAAEARSAATGRPAQSAGDVFLSLRSFAEAEEMFKLALEKGGVDRDQILTRIGIAQAQQGKYAEAKATFTQVSGARAPVARMWNAYVSSRA